uniref:TOG domain-containing protein n=1 Tax=Megaselia scalaris TaxID=36166 RepID=T1GCW2_MEGSC
LRKIRSLLINNVQNVIVYLKDLSISFLDILKELRSQVIREACITIAYMSKCIRNKLDQFCIYILQELINLIQNSAKVISSAGTVALKYVIKYTHAPKLLPIITTTYTQSKSKDIRSTLCDILCLIFEEWQTKSLERNATTLRDMVKKGIADADNDARRNSRRAFWAFRKHFPDIADQVYSGLDPATQKTLERERDILSGNGGSMSASLRGSNSSLNSMPGGVIKRRTSTGLRSPATHTPSAQKSLEAFTELIKRLGPDFNAYTATVFPHVIDRLGDSKDTVREKAQLLLHNLMEYRVLTPQQLIDKLTPCFKHKNSKVREEFLQTIVNTLNEHGTAQLSVKSYIQPIVSLLGDPTSTVRDASIHTLVEIYKHVEQKFDEVKEEGLLLKSATSSHANGNGFQDETDTTSLQPPVRPTRLVKRTVSASAKKPTSLDVQPSLGDAGAISWEVFEASFEQVPSINIYTQKDIEDHFKNIIQIIGNKNVDWEKRVDA